MRLLLISCLMALTACAGSKKTTEGQAISPAEDVWDTSFTVMNATVRGDSLLLSLQFGGGFRVHEFRLETGGAATKSLPRQQPLNLIHNGHGDMGRALITEERAFDLRPFRDPSQPLIRLRLSGWPDLLDYAYPKR